MGKVRKTDEGQIVDAHVTWEILGEVITSESGKKVDGFSGGLGLLECLAPLLSKK